MTPIKSIVDALSGYNLPWEYLFHHFPKLGGERSILNQYLKITSSDRLMGLKEQGIATHLANLTFMAYQLRNYKGIGSPDNPVPVPLKAILKILETYKENDTKTVIQWPTDEQDYGICTSDIH